MNLYKRTVCCAALCFLLTILIIITLKPIPYDTSSDLSYRSELSAQNKGKSVSDAELTSFLNVNNALSSLKEYLREQLLFIADEYGMTKERYNQIAAMENDPQAISDATEDEIETAKIISGRIMELQFEIQRQALSIINEYKLTAERFLEIAEQLSKDTALQRRFDKLTRSLKHSRKTMREFIFRFCIN